VGGAAPHLPAIHIGAAVAYPGAPVHPLPAVRSAGVQGEHRGQPSPLLITAHPSILSTSSSSSTTRRPTLATARASPSPAWPAAAAGTAGYRRARSPEPLHPRPTHQIEPLASLGHSPTIPRPDPVDPRPELPPDRRCPRPGVALRRRKTSQGPNCKRVTPIVKPFG
jgi:hypothetical protein